MKTVFLRPCGEATIIDLKTGQPIPAEGKAVVMDKYYRRRIADGDAEIIAPESTTPISQPSNTSEGKKSKSK